MTGEAGVLATRIPGPFGELELRASTRGVTRLIVTSRLDQVPPLTLIDLDDEAAPASLPADLSPAVGHLRLAALQVSEYLAGRRSEFSVPLDVSAGVSPFAASVHEAIRTIPLGTTVSYAQLASMVGRPHAVRAVGTACVHNPVPIIVPCHRIVRSDGSLGNYTGGVEYKHALLTLEGALH